MTDEKTGWALLHSKLPPAAIRPLSQSVYGVSGLSDVNEAYLIQRLFASGLIWEWKLSDPKYLGFEDRTIKGRDGKPDYELRYYMASVNGILIVDGREFHGSGASDNRKLDAAFKGAGTVAFKNACKWVGLTIELYKDGKAMDFIYEDRQGNVIQQATGEIEGSAESKAALQEAQGSDQRQRAQDSPPSTAIQEAAAAVTPEPSAASSGPRAKRGNVVKAPQAAEKPKVTPVDEIGSELSASPPTPPQAAPVALDEGEEVYRAELRHQARAGAAVLRQLRIKMKNSEAALNGQALQPEPPATPNADSEASLAAFVNAKHPGKTLDTLAEKDLESVVEQIDALIARVQESLK